MMNSFSYIPQLSCCSGPYVSCKNVRQSYLEREIKCFRKSKFICTCKARRERRCRSKELTRFSSDLRHCLFSHFHSVTPRLCFLSTNSPQGLCNFSTKFASSPVQPFLLCSLSKGVKNEASGSWKLVHQTIILMTVLSLLRDLETLLQQSFSQHLWRGVFPPTGSRGQVKTVQFSLLKSWDSEVSLFLRKMALSMRGNPNS